jgi:hypothetical protein
MHRYGFSHLQRLVLHAMCSSDVHHILFPGYGAQGSQSFEICHSKRATMNRSSVSHGRLLDLCWPLRSTPYSSVLLDLSFSTSPRPRRLYFVAQLCRRLGTALSCGHADHCSVLPRDFGRPLLLTLRASGRWMWCDGIQSSLYPLPDATAVVSLSEVTPASTFFAPSIRLPVLVPLPRCLGKYGTIQMV